MQVKIKDSKFIVGPFDKKDNFPFSIVIIPYKSSNLPSNRFYSAIGAETLPIAKANDNANSFCLSLKLLIFRMVKQGAQNDKLSNVLKKTLNIH